MDSDADQPAIVCKQSALLTLNKGSYYWCACGLSKKQPFCDKSHKTTKFTPVKFEVIKDNKAVSLCMCKRTKFPPDCDGTHRKI